MISLTRSACPVSFQFPKSEKLNRKKEIDVLFANGSSFTVYPIRLKYIYTKQESQLKLLLVVPKKKFKKATERNKLKRRISESLRLNLPFYRDKLIGFHFAIIYSSNQIHEFHFIESKLKQALIRLSTFDLPV